MPLSRYLKLVIISLQLVQHTSFPKKRLIYYTDQGHIAVSQGYLGECYLLTLCFLFRNASNQHNYQPFSFLIILTFFIPSSSHRFLIFVELLSNPNILPTLRYLTKLASMTQLEKISGESFTKRICKKRWKMLYKKYVSDLNL